VYSWKKVVKGCPEGCRNVVHFVTADNKSTPGEGREKMTQRARNGKSQEKKKKKKRRRKTEEKQQLWNIIIKSHYHEVSQQ
jgi:hypothetical protein